MDEAAARVSSCEEPAGMVSSQELDSAVAHSAAVVAPTPSSPGGGDERPWPKQRRKRTSVEDQAILEAAYLADPKPDKAARQAIVDRVALSEKEVQIWFQNRRQSSRRKTRPLLPHEIIQYHLSRSGSGPVADALSSPGTSFEAEDSKHDAQEDKIIPRQALPETETFTENSSQAVDLSDPNPRPSIDAQQSASIAKVTLQSIGYLANRRSAQFLAQKQETGATMQSNNSSRQDRSLRRSTSSQVRLSMSFDGNASVVNGSSPSPPRAPPTMLSSSQSSAGGPDAAGAGKKINRSLSGRSRDSRAWEFWCDRDARNELGEKAEKVASGSAADAIGLLRSTSGRSILAPVGAKRNLLSVRPDLSAKRTKLESKTRPLQRSSTSSGRLQNHHLDDDNNSPSKRRPRLKYSESAVSVYIPGNESDKENWSPDRDVRSIRGGDDNEALKSLHSHHHDRNRQDSRPKLAPRKKDRNDPEVDPEVAAFMRGGRKSGSVSSEDDLDCIQGLLSLSQGNWR